MLSETFVTGEAREVGRITGTPPQVLAVLRGGADLEDAPPARYLVELARADQWRALLRSAATRPLRTARALLSPARRHGGSPRDVAALAPFARALRGTSWIHAHFATQPAAIAARLAELTGIPFSFTAHAHDVFVDPDRLEEKLEHAALAVTVCEYTRDHILELAPAAAGGLHVVPCGVDLERFRRERPYDPGGPLVAVGRLVPQKGFDTLVRAAALAGGAISEVVIAGDGPLRGELERLIHELAAPVRLLGSTPHADVRDLLESASLAVLPSVIAPDGSRDSVPVVLHEALALGLPVVASAVCGLPERIEPAHGVLVPPGDVQALADALAGFFAHHAEERADMGTAARAYAEAHLGLDRTTRRLLSLIAAAGGPSPPRVCT